jgi:hypothetical protein
MQGGKVVAIHQPNFFPWLGYFNKIACADVFVVLDNVQFPKTGGTWCNRVRLSVNGKVAWTTMPVVRSYGGVRLIRDMAIRDAPWRGKFLQALRQSYGRAPYFDTIYPFVEELTNHPADRVADFNFFAIRALSQYIGLDPSKLVSGSTLEVKGKATDLLIAIVEAVGGTAYLCGAGAAGYQDDEKFAAEGLAVIYQDFRHPVYHQQNGNEFIPGLSIIDALMNCGRAHTYRLVMNSQPSSSIRTNFSGSVAAT